jgi:hypothetical protein
MVLGSDRPPEMNQAEFERRLKLVVSDLPTVLEGHALLMQYVREVVDELTERRGLIELREERDRARAIVKARVDVSAEGVKRSRYEAMSDRAHHAALRQLRGLQEMRRKSGKVGPEGSGAQEPQEDRETEASAPAQTEANAAPAPAQTEANAVPAPAQSEVNAVAAPARSEANAAPAPAQTEANAVAAPAQSEANATTQEQQEDRGTEAAAPAQSEADAVPAPAQSEANATQVAGGAERRNEDAPGPGGIVAFAESFATAELPVQAPSPLAGAQGEGFFCLPPRDAPWEDLFLPPSPLAGEGRCRGSVGTASALSGAPAPDTPHPGPPAQGGRE